MTVAVGSSPVAGKPNTGSALPLTSIGSLNTTVNANVPLPTSASLTVPTLAETLTTVGFKRSMVTVSGVASKLSLPAASVNLSALTVTEPTPSSSSSAVNVA